MKNCCRYQRDFSTHFSQTYADGIENVIDLVKSDFYSKKSSDPCYDFFSSSALAHLISLEIASATYANQCMSYEGLCKKIPPKLGCRSTIYSTLNTAVSKGFFTKKLSSEDRRIRSYCLSENYSLMLTRVVFGSKKIFLKLI